LGLLNLFYNLNKGSQTLTAVVNPVRFSERLADIDSSEINAKVTLTPMRKHSGINADGIKQTVQ
jgi:hypothetical protein